MNFHFQRLAMGIIVMLLLFTVLPVWSASTASGAAPSVLSLTIRCTNTVIKAGDEIPIEFCISNGGVSDYHYEDRNYDRSGRMNEYKLVAKDAAGEVVADPRANHKGGWFGGGMFQEGILKPGKSFVKIIPLNRWALVKAGRYEVVGEYSAAYSTNFAIVKSAPVTITVLPRTPQEMDDYISDLTRKITTLPPGSDPALDDLAKQLMYTCSPKAVPTLLECMYLPGYSCFWEAEGLLFYIPRSSETKRIVLDMATKRGLGSNMGYVLEQYGCTDEEMRPIIERSLATNNPQAWPEGARAAQTHPNDSFTPRLIALATGAGNAARMQAIFALAANRTDDGVKALKVSLNDKDPHIRELTAQAVQAAYCYRGIWHGRPLKPGDFDEKYQKPDLGK